MSRRAASFTQADVARAARGALEAGLAVVRIEVDNAGRIAIICAEGAQGPAGGADDVEARLKRARGWAS